jgi:hypothetical protein
MRPKALPQEKQEVPGKVSLEEQFVHPVYKLYTFLENTPNSRANRFNVICLISMRIRF